VGKTGYAEENHGYGQKHPHGRGEDDITVQSCSAIEKHPHGRGEDLKEYGSTNKLIETPPRAWGRRIKPNLRRCQVRNTPTGVGKTVRYGGLAILNTL